jgi:parallel beta-helix repeat protein
MSTTYYVSGNGRDSSNGLSTKTAFRTIQKAADLTLPGDTVYVMNGTYTEAYSFKNIVTITRSGTPNAWITYRAYPGHSPLLQSQNWHGFSIQGAAYIKIEGFEIEGNNANVTLAEAIAQQTNLNNPLTSGNGIGVGPSLDGKTYAHHIVIRNNQVHGLGGGGIYTFRADYITIDNNRVYNNGWYSPYGCSGISTLQNRNSDNNTGTKMVIRGNTVYGNANFVPFFSQGYITDGNGIIVDDSLNTLLDSPLGAYEGRTLIANNVVYANGGRGIHVYRSSSVNIVGNMLSNNSQHPAIADAELSLSTSQKVNLVNNTVAPAFKVPVFLERWRISRDCLIGTVHGDRLVGSAGSDILIGGQGQDNLSGSWGNDILMGGMGQDTLRGGDGRDTFVIEKRGGLDLIQDFKPLDRLGLTNGIRSDDLSFTSSNRGTIVRIGQEKLALLVGVHTLEVATIGF